MSRQKKTNKISKTDKVTIGALSLLGIVGGWNIIGNIENSTSAKNIANDEVASPIPAAIRPTPKPWPTIQPLVQASRLEINPLPTLAARVAPETETVSSDQLAENRVESLDLSGLPSAAPLPTLAPLPALPEYVPPPPPPPSKPSSNGGGGGGDNRSKGS